VIIVGDVGRCLEEIGWIFLMLISAWAMHVEPKALRTCLEEADVEIEEKGE